MKKLTREELEIVAAVSHLGVELTAKNCMFYNAAEKYISRSNGALKYLAFEKKADDTICTIDEFNKRIEEMSNHAGAHAFNDYAEAVKTPLQPECKKTVVDVVSHYKATPQQTFLEFDGYAYHPGFGFGYCGEDSKYFICYLADYDKCIDDLTGCQIELAAWLTALNDARDKQIDWKNGDECVFKGEKYTFECVTSYRVDSCILSSGGDIVDATFAQICNISKPETPEQKAARERAELICRWTDDVFHDLSLEQLAELLVDAGVKLPKRQ